MNRVISDAGLCSRREADRLIQAGRVQVDGVIAQLGMKVDPTSQILIDGKRLIYQNVKRLLVLNKPRGVVCTTDRRWGDTLVADLIDVPERVYPIGRLDKDSEGLILMTNQGELLNKIMKSENNHEKEYEVYVNRPLTNEELRKLARGVYLPELNRTTKSCRVERVKANGFRIILTQGLNRQIRRMCQSIGAQVISLRRIRIMNIRLGSLPTGMWRSVTPEEEKQLLRSLKDSADNTEMRWRTNDKARV